jgi:hypothetical protein
MFNLDVSDSYWWPVKFVVPKDDGKVDTFTFDGLFRRLSTDELTELQNSMLEKPVSDREIALKLLIGWRGVSSKSGDVPFSVAAFERALNITGCGTGVCEAWKDSLAQGPRKN